VVLAGDTLVEPLMGSVPDQPPLAVHADALVLLQLTVDPAPC